jgi:molybdopterin converting factor small subunit
VPNVIVGLPASLTSSDGPRDVPCEASTVGEALRALVERLPQYESRIFYGDRLLVVITVNGGHVAPGTVQETGLADGDRVDLLLPVAGG